jgi:hypothetical protein
MPGSRELRALDAGGGLWLIVSSVAAREYDEAALARGLQNLEWVGRRAMAHESVVERFLTAPAVLPMQLFTLFSSDERAFEHVARDRARIDRIVTRIERQLEWGLRLAFDEKAARTAVDAGREGARGRARDASGVSYLARKRDLLKVSRVQLSEARIAADRLYEAMSHEATRASRRTATEQGMPGSRLLLDAAFLVPKTRSTAFRAAVRRNTRHLAAAGLVVSLTGPWPAYNFIDADGSGRTNTTAEEDRRMARTSARRPARTAARKTSRTAVPGSARPGRRR